jgi:integrase
MRPLGPSSLAPLHTLLTAPNSALLAHPSYRTLPPLLQDTLVTALTRQWRASTQRHYLGVWRRFSRFAADVGRAPLPPDGVLMAAFLAGLRFNTARPLRARTVTGYCSALRAVVQLTGHALSAADDRLLAQTLRAAVVMDGVEEREWLRPTGELSGQGAALLPEHLLAFSRVHPLPPLDALVISAASVAFFCLLRVHEYLPSSDRPGLLWTDVAADFTYIIIRRPKRGPTAAVAVPEGPFPALNPRHHLRRLADLSGRPPRAPVFTLAGTPLHAALFTARLRALAAHARVLSGQRIVPHGLRRGGCTWLLAAGADPLAVQHHGRWAQLASLRPYYTPSVSATSSLLFSGAPHSIGPHRPNPIDGSGDTRKRSRRGGSGVAK